MQPSNQVSAGRPELRCQLFRRGVCGWLYRRRVRSVETIHGIWTGLWVRVEMLLRGEERESAGPGVQQTVQRHPGLGGCKRIQGLGPGPGQRVLEKGAPRMCCGSEEMAMRLGLGLGCKGSRRCFDSARRDRRTRHFRCSCGCSSRPGSGCCLSLR